MPDFYRLAAGTANPSNAIQEIVLAKADDGTPTKVVSREIPARLTAEDRKKVERFGCSLEHVSKGQAETAPETDSGDRGGDSANDNKK